jgi:hypothetical protein
MYIQAMRVQYGMCTKYITYLVISISNEESFLGRCGRNFKTHICLRHLYKKLKKHYLPMVNIVVEILLKQIVVLYR